MDPIDRVGTLGADRAPAGLSNFTVMKSDPVWSQLAGELAAQQNLVKELKAKFNAVLAKLDGEAQVANDYVSLHAATSPDPAL